MDKISTGTSIILSIFLFGPWGGAWGACKPPSETNATSVVEQSGHGNLTCGNFAGKGGFMVAISASVEFSPGNKSIGWSVIPPLEADAVIVESSDGKHCTYGYPDNAIEDTGLTPPGKSVKSVTVCSDGFSEPAAPLPPPEPIVGPKNACSAPEFSTLIGIGERSEKDPDDPGQDLVAVCSDSQLQCDNQCFRPEGYPENTKIPGCELIGLNGEIDLNCRACELSTIRPPQQGEVYCWELSHQVDEVANTFIPPTVTQPGRASWQKFEGSTCVLITTSYFGVEYSYWAPAGCP